MDYLPFITIFHGTGHTYSRNVVSDSKTPGISAPSNRADKSLVYSLDMECYLSIPKWTVTDSDLV